MVTINGREVAIGEALRLARLSSKLSMHQLAARVGITQSCISRAERIDTHMLSDTWIAALEECGYRVVLVKK